MSYTTSAVYTVARVLEARLRAITFPSPPANTISETPAVWFGDPEQPQPDENNNPPNATERCVLLSRVESPTINWGTIGQYARDEAFTMSIFCESSIQGRTALQAWARVEELTAAIEADVRSQFQASRPTATYPVALAPYQKWSIAVASVLPVAPVSPASQGYSAAAEVTIGCTFTINRTAIP